MMGITKETCAKIKALFDAGYTCVEIAEKFGLKESLIRSIVNR